MVSIPEVEVEEYQHLEVNLHKFKEVVKELLMKITYFEARVVPTTPPEELECRENQLKDVVARLTTLKYEYQQLYNEVGHTWKIWIEDEDIKQESQNFKEV